MASDADAAADCTFAARQLKSWIWSDRDIQVTPVMNATTGFGVVARSWFYGHEGIVSDPPKSLARTGRQRQTIRYSFAKKSLPFRHVLGSFSPLVMAVTVPFPGSVRVKRR